MWEGGECWILGGGDSLPRQFGVPDDLIQEVQGGKAQLAVYSPYLEPIHDKHVIGVNNMYMLGHWPDVCFFGDCGWYLVHRLALANWPNLKVTCCNRFANKPKEKSEGIKYLPKNTKHRFGISEDRNTVSWNSNSGAAAISLAAHFGVKRVILLGFDMCLGPDGQSHCHKGHGNKKPPPFARHLKGFPEIASDAARMGIEILNASPVSAIDNFPKVEVKDLL
jgi:hypothetical protein